MNKTLKKALAELNKENPSIDYIKGMLEVLIDDEPEVQTPTINPVIPVVEPPPFTGGVMINKKSI